MIRAPRLRRMSLRVDPGGQIVVRAPRRVSDMAIAKFVQEQSMWIEKQKSRMDSLVSIPQAELQELRKIAKISLPARLKN